MQSGEAVIMRLVRGLATSAGKSWGRIVYYDEHIAVDRKETNAQEDVQKHLDRLFLLAKEQLQETIAQQERTGFSTCSQIARAHLEILQDVKFVDQLRALVEKYHLVSFAFEEILRYWREHFSQMNNPYYQDRFSDFHDVVHRLFALTKKRKPVAWPERCIIYSRGALPSSIMDVPSEKLVGVICGHGNHACHLSILSRARGVPCVNALFLSKHVIPEGSVVMLNGEDGLLLINPTKEELRSCPHSEQEEGWNETALLPSELKDGTKLGILANIDCVEQLQSALHARAEGIGLVRSEYLALALGRMPTFEEQVRYYHTILETPFLPKIIRLFDFGSDKLVGCVPKKHELNPALGLRGVRHLLQERHLLQAQIAALCCAWKELKNPSAEPLSIMIPMVTHLEDVLEVARVLQELTAHYELERAPKLGVMLEIPSAVFSVDLIAPYCDFFSLGSNDLLQYSCAAERSGGESRDWFNAMDVGFLRLVHYAVKHCAQTGKPLSICGELACTPRCASALIGMGVRNFSLGPAQIPAFKRHIQDLTLEEAKEEAQLLLSGRLAPPDSGTLGAASYSQQLCDRVKK